MDNTKKIGFIINPISGTRAKLNIPDLINKKFNSNGVRPVVKFTTCAGNATVLAKEMVDQGFSLVVAVGGDGTINEVAKSLIHTNVALGIVPCGSGNGLARHLGIPLKTELAIDLLNHYKVAEIDYGTANDIVFFCTCGVGFDAQIGYQFAQSKTRGFFTYIKSVIAEFFSYKAKKYKFKTEKNKFKKRAFLITFANASQYGNNAYIAPNADIQDGLLDVCILKPFPSYKVVEIGYKLMKKKLHRCESVEYLRTDKIRIKRKKSGIFHYDGEPCLMKKKIVVKAHQRGLKVAVPIDSKLN